MTGRSKSSQRPNTVAATAIFWSLAGANPMTHIGVSQSNLRRRVRIPSLPRSTNPGDGFPGGSSTTNAVVPGSRWSCQLAALPA